MVVQLLIKDQYKEDQLQIYMSQTPKFIDEYKVHLILGEGGQAIVYLCTKKGINELLSIKVYLKQQNRDFEREVAILKQISHENVIEIKGFNPNAVIIYQSKPKQIRPILILQFAYYGDLYSILQCKQGRLSQGTCKFLFKRILCGLQFLQKINISHRDLKLQNILLDKNFNIKLIDFGSCFALSQNIDEFNETRNYGTQYYKAPQVYRAEFNCQKIDIFASAVLLFCLFFGRFPFASSKFSNKQYTFIRQEQYQQFWKITLNKKRKQQPILDNNFTKMINRMLCFDPQKRITLQNTLKQQWLNTNIPSFQQVQTELKNKFQQVLKSDQDKSSQYCMILNLINQLNNQN